MPQYYLAMNQALRVCKAKLMHAIKLFSALLASFFFSATVSAQVFNSGPSDPALFTNVFSLPGDVLPDSRAAGGVAGETTQVNVANGGNLGNPGLGLGSPGFNAFDGSEINVSGGTVGSGLIAHDGSEVNISGGSVGTVFNARDGSEVNISGGFVGFSFRAAEGSVVNISGGSWGQSFDACAGSDVELIGGEFKLNGEAFTDSTISVGVNDTFTGTLADGSPFIFANNGIGDLLSNVSLTLSSEPLPEASLIPMVVATPVDFFPRGLREGQSLTVQAGGELNRDFQVVDATLNVDGGTVGDSLEVAGSGSVNISDGSVVSLNAYAGSEVNINGGSLGNNGTAGRASGSMVNISGGRVGSFELTGGSLNISGGNMFNSILVRGSETKISGGSVNNLIASGSEVNISGDSVINSFRASDGSEVNIRGGSFGNRFSIDDGSVVNISGGSVGDSVVFMANFGSVVNLLGSDFVLDGVLLDDLILGEAFTIPDRDVRLSGSLADGSTFSIDLNSEFIRFDPLRDTFDPGATLTVTLVSPVILGDVNQDGDVNILDISPFISILAAGDFQAEADTNEDGVVNFLDINSFIALLTSS